MDPGTLLRLARPHFLLGGAVMYAVGAFTAGVTDPVAYLVGQSAVTASQLTAHFVNEYADAEADVHIVNRTWFSGGSGVLPEHPGLERMALRASVVTTGAAVVLALVLALDRPAAAAVVLGTIVVSWIYSVPPIRLLSTGWGEVATSLVVAVAVPIAGSLSQGVGVPGPLWTIVAALFFVHVAMMIAFELPDLDSDREAGKRVLAVRLGRRRSIEVMGAAFLVGFSITGLASAVDSGLAWMLLGTPAAIATTWSATGDRFTVLTTSAVATLVLTASGALARLIV